MARNRKGAAAGANSGSGLGTGTNLSNAQKSNASANARKKDSSSSTGTPSINGSNASGGGVGGGGGGGGGGTSANSSKSMNQLKTQFFVMTPTQMFLGCCCLLIASYFCYIGYLETRVNTPFDDNKMVQRTGLDDPERFWGSYRPGNYFGMKTRDPNSLVMGLMWFSPMRLGPGGEGIRHWCESGDDLDQYGWLQHDGRTFGIQEIKDYPFTLETSFVKFPNNKNGGDWTARISVQNAQADSVEPISLVWYAALDEKTIGSLTTTSAKSKTQTTGIRGETSGLGEFSLSLDAVNGTIKHQSHLSTVAPSLQYLRQVLTSHLYLTKDKLTNTRVIALPGEILRNNKGEVLEPNFVAIMITAQAPFALDISYRSLHNLTPKDVRTLPQPAIGVVYSQMLATKRREFDDRFEQTFRLKEKGYGLSEIKFAQAAMSNMIGGIGYFHGSSRVQSVYTKDPVPYWRAPLYTAVPSRSFFPRGFLWDEGFHGLLIATWDVDIELDIISHWFDLMNVEGWIPREQILGVEALAKVPEEFVTQRNTNANPPTFFLTLKYILTKYSHQLATNGRLNTLERIYPRLQSWIAWYNTTQRGELPGTYRWRGRDNYKENELNPKTLTSGLDDYPRASHPTNDERHVDLRCWIAFATGVMADIAHLLGHDDSKYLETHYYLSDNMLLNELHLSPYTETFSDYGLHTDAVAIKAVRPVQSPQQQYQKSQYQQPIEKVRVALKPAEYRFVDSTFGYVSLFPFLLEILTPDSFYLDRILKNIRDPEILWTKYGLRSLSKQSPMYHKRNTDDDPPYWRGQIWMNINYLALKALHHYGSQPGPYSEDAKSIYLELRQNIVNNIILQYKRSGYIWEQYNDRTGEGSGCKPFNGWTALVVLIMSEQY